MIHIHSSIEFHDKSWLFQGHVATELAFNHSKMFYFINPRLQWRLVLVFRQQSWPVQRATKAGDHTIIENVCPVLHRLGKS